MGMDEDAKRLMISSPHVRPERGRASLSRQGAACNLSVFFLKRAEVTSLKGLKRPKALDEGEHLRPWKSAQTT